MFKREDRLNELIVQQVSELIRTIKDPGLSGLLTITGAELSKDRKTARVYFSVLGSPEDRDSTAQALNRASNFIRSELRGRLRLKVIPQLLFQFDDTAERAQRIDTILEQLKHEDKP